MSVGVMLTCLSHLTVGCAVLFSGQKIQSSVERMFRIWRDRKVYDKEFVKCLDQLLAGQQEEKSGE